MVHPPRDAILLALLANIAFSHVSAEKEIAIGQSLAAEIDSKNQVVTDPEVTGLLDRVLKRLSASEALRLPLKLKVVYNSEPIASALPGGYLVLSLGAILGTDNES